MAESVYKFIELVGSSETSFEDAIHNAVETAAKTLRDLRIAEVIKLDAKILNNEIVMYRARVNLSFKFEE
ncbi:MAG: dodecin domain-containing protein [Candidatus Lokiarchaeota archaeon]|nr:dodecin domain-containing protein [Candidatus Lokiarchaeota archaeon]